MIDEAKPPLGWSALPGRPDWCARDDTQTCKRLRSAHIDCREEAAPYIAEALELREAAALAVWNAPSPRIDRT